MPKIIEYTSISKGIEGKEGDMCHKIRFSKSVVFILLNLLSLDSALKLQYIMGKWGI